MYSRLQIEYSINLDIYLPGVFIASDLGTERTVQRVSSSKTKNPSATKYNTAPRASAEIAFPALYSRFEEKKVLRMRSKETGTEHYGCNVMPIHLRPLSYEV